MIILSKKSEAYFPGHERKSTEKIDEIAHRLRLSASTRNYLKIIVHRHGDVINYPEMMNERSARRFLSKFDNPAIVGDVFEINRADSKGSGRDPTVDLETIDRFQRIVEKVMVEKQPYARSDLKVTGHDLMDLGIPASPTLGRIQRQLMEEVVDEPERNTKDYLLQRAKELAHGQR